MTINNVIKKTEKIVKIQITKVLMIKNQPEKEIIF